PLQMPALVPEWPVDRADRGVPQDRAVDGQAASIETASAVGARLMTPGSGPRYAAGGGDDPGGESELRGHGVRLRHPTGIRRRHPRGAAQVRPRRPGPPSGSRMISARWTNSPARDGSRAYSRQAYAELQPRCRVAAARIAA